MSWLRALSAAILLMAPAAFAEAPPTPTSSPLGPRARATLSSDQAAKISAERSAAQAKCWADLETLCPGMKNRQDRVRCIRTNRQNLPPSCQVAQQARGAPIRSACSADAERLCGDLPRGRKRFLCLIEHRPEVSPACAQALDQRRGGPGPVRGPLGGAGG